MDIPKIAISGKEIQLWAQKLYLLLLLISDHLPHQLPSWPRVGSYRAQSFDLFYAHYKRPDIVMLIIASCIFLEKHKSRFPLDTQHKWVS